MTTESYEVYEGALRTTTEVVDPGALADAVLSASPGTAPDSGQPAFQPDGIPKGCEVIGGFPLVAKLRYETDTVRPPIVPGDYKPLQAPLRAYLNAEAKAAAAYDAAQSAGYTHGAALRRDVAAAEAAVSAGKPVPAAEAPDLVRPAYEAARKADASYTVAHRLRTEYASAVNADVSLKLLSLERLEGSVESWRKSQRAAEAMAGGITAAALFVRQLLPYEAQGVYEQANALGTNAAGISNRDEVNRTESRMRDFLADVRAGLSGPASIVGVAFMQSTNGAPAPFVVLDDADGLGHRLDGHATVSAGVRACGEALGRPLYAGMSLGGWVGPPMADEVLARWRAFAKQAGGTGVITLVHERAASAG